MKQRARYRVPAETLLISAVACDLWEGAEIGDIPTRKRSVHRRLPCGNILSTGNLILLPILAATAFKDKYLPLTLFVISLSDKEGRHAPT